MKGYARKPHLPKRGDPDRTEWVVQSLYLPPDDRRAATEAYIEDSRRKDGAVYVGGRHEHENAQAKERRGSGRRNSDVWRVVAEGERTGEPGQGYEERRKAERRTGLHRGR